MTRLITGLCLYVIVIVSAGADQSQFDRYLALTQPEKSADMKHLGGFKRVFSDLQVEGLPERIRQTYAEELYFNDTFVTLERRDDLIEYMIMTAEKANYVRTTILDEVQSGDNLYVRWVLEMEFDIMGKPRYSRTPGMTHLKFDEQGLITLHQDFWDSAAGFYQYIPVLGRMTNWVRKKMHH